MTAPQVDPKKRITMSKLVAHPWLLPAADPATPTASAGKPAPQRRPSFNTRTLQLARQVDAVRATFRKASFKERVGTPDGGNNATSGTGTHGDGSDEDACEEPKLAESVRLVLPAELSELTSRMLSFTGNMPSVAESAEEDPGATIRAAVLQSAHSFTEGAARRRSTAEREPPSRSNSFTAHRLMSSRSRPLAPSSPASHSPTGSSSPRLPGSFTGGSRFNVGPTEGGHGGGGALSQMTLQTERSRPATASSKSGFFGNMFSRKSTK